MEIRLDLQGDFESLKKHILALSARGIKNIMMFQGQGGLEKKGSLKKDYDMLLKKSYRTGRCWPLPDWKAGSG